MKTSWHLKSFLGRIIPVTRTVLEVPSYKRVLDDRICKVFNKQVPDSIDRNIGNRSLGGKNEMGHLGQNDSKQGVIHMCDSL